MHFPQVDAPPRYCVWPCVSNIARELTATLWLSVDTLLLRTFVEVVQRGGFNAAADTLGLAQPSLTRRIQRLEHQLGMQLLERGPWGFRLTRKGEVFYRGALRVLAVVEDVTLETTEAKGETIRLGAAATAAGSFLAERLSGWIPAHPEVHLVMIEDGARNMLRRLEKRECDIGIVAAPLPEHFDSRFVTRVTVQALLPPTHRLAATSLPLSVEELHREQVLLNGRGFLSTELLLSACHVVGVEPEPVYECSVGQTLAALAEGGLGIAVMGDSVDLRGFSLPSRQVCDGDGTVLTFDLHLAWLRDRLLSPACCELVDYLTPLET